MLSADQKCFNKSIQQIHIYCLSTARQSLCGNIMPNKSPCPQEFWSQRSPTERYTSLGESATGVPGSTEKRMTSSACPGWGRPAHTGSDVEAGSWSFSLMIKGVIKSHLDKAANIQRGGWTWREGEGEKWKIRLGLSQTSNSQIGKNLVLW